MMRILLWTLSALMILLPGLSYFLWRIDILDSNLFLRHSGITMMAYVVGNIGGLIFITSAIWKLTRADSENKSRFPLVAGVITIIVFAIAGFIGMGNYIMEFIAG